MRHLVAPGTAPLAMPRGLSAGERREWVSLVAELQAVGRELTAADGSSLRIMVATTLRLRARDLPSSTFAALSANLARQRAVFLAPPAPPPRLRTMPTTAPAAPDEADQLEGMSSSWQDTQRKWNFKLGKSLPPFTPVNFPELDWTVKPSKGRRT